jgi:3-isopropylmalate/(R)-2-methylmalate dehydratase small subunit
MDAFHTHTGIGVPLRRSNVDTDQIIPAVYLKRVTRTGFDDGLFAAWRTDPSFVLNLSPFDRGSVLVAGPDFGTGSSREHAVWALMDYGFRVVISSRFGDIFRGNAGKSGLLAAEVAQDDVELLWKLIESSPGLEITVNLQDRNVAAGTVVVPFKIDDYTAWRLLEGLDDIALTLRKQDQIEVSVDLETDDVAHSLTAQSCPNFGRRMAVFGGWIPSKPQAMGGNRIPKKFARNH